MRKDEWKEMEWILKVSVSMFVVVSEGTVSSW